MAETRSLRDEMYGTGLVRANNSPEIPRSQTPLRLFHSEFGKCKVGKPTVVTRTIGECKDFLQVTCQYSIVSYELQTHRRSPKQNPELCNLPSLQVVTSPSIGALVLPNAYVLTVKSLFVDQGDLYGRNNYIYDCCLFEEISGLVLLVTCDKMVSNV